MMLMFGIGLVVVLFALYLWMSRPGRRFCMQYRRALFTSSVVFGALCLCSILTGCAGLPTWLADAEKIIPVLAEGAASILSLISALTGNAVAAGVLSEISAWASKIEAGIKNIQDLVAQYQTTPGESLLNEIESAVNLVVGDIGSFASIVGVPAVLATKVQAPAQFLLTELESWASLLPALKAAAVAGTKITITVPLDQHAFRHAWNNLLNEPSGDPAVDLALAKAKRL